MNRTFLALLLLPAVALSAPVPKVKDGTLLVTKWEGGSGTVIEFHPDGTQGKVVLDPETTKGKYSLTLSPDRKKAAFTTVERKGESLRGWMTDLASGKETELFGVEMWNNIFWAPDGSKVYFIDSNKRLRKKGKPDFHDDWRWRTADANTGEVETLQVEAECEPFGFTADGKSFLCHRLGEHIQTAPQHFVIGRELVSTGWKKVDPEVLIPASKRVTFLAAFPDAKRWVVRKTVGNELGVYTAGDNEPQFWGKDSPAVNEVVVSPDGRQVAYTVGPTEEERLERLKLEIQRLKQGVKAEETPEVHTLWVAHADGKNARRVWEPKLPITLHEWR